MIYIFLADGFEELEAIAPIDLLRRAGVALQTVGIGSTTPTGSHDVILRCDISEDEVDCAACTGVILPGGPGHKHLAKSAVVRECLAAVAAKDGMLAAICAAPSILGKQGYLQGRRATCYPGFEDKLIGATIVDASVVVDGNVITARAASASIEFALACVEYCCGNAKANEIAAQICHER